MAMAFSVEHVDQADRSRVRAWRIGPERRRLAAGGAEADADAVACETTPLNAAAEASQGRRRAAAAPKELPVFQANSLRTGNISGNFSDCDWFYFTSPSQINCPKKRHPSLCNGEQKQDYFEATRFA
jgi:hypothetical protein